MEHCGDVKPSRASSVGECGITVAVVGQPSTGKSTFFTYVTGEVVRIASWPGTTVEQRVASVEYRGVRLCFVDLPGIYGLAATSPEEAITKKFLLEGEYDVVLVLVDPLVIERSIYLPLQLAEMGVKLVVAVTKWDVVHKSGLHVDVSKVSARLGVPVVPISSITGEGVDELMSVLVEV
ncbi:MAG: FeoB small GTPase domain-containing protein, partial [Zestosphaera sp.]